MYPRARAVEPKQGRFFGISFLALCSSFISWSPLRMTRIYLVDNIETRIGFFFCLGHVFQYRSCRGLVAISFLGSICQYERWLFLLRFKFRKERAKGYAPWHKIELHRFVSDNFALGFWGLRAGLYCAPYYTITTSSSSSLKADVDLESRNDKKKNFCFFIRSG